MRLVYLHSKNLRPGMKVVLRLDANQKPVKRAETSRWDIIGQDDKGRPLGVKPHYKENHKGIPLLANAYWKVVE